MTESIDKPTTRRCLALLIAVIGVTPFYLNDFYNPALASRPVLFWLVEIVTWIIFPVVLFFAGLKLNAFRACDLGLSTQFRGQTTSVGLWVAIVAFAAVCIPLDRFLFDTAIDVAGRPSGDYGFDYMSMVPPRGPKTGWYRLAAIVHLSLTAGVVEEVLYRGVVRHVIGRGVLRTVIFLLVSSVLFAGAHWGPGQAKLLYAFMGGVAFGLVYVLCDNIYPSIVAHCIVDMSWFMEAGM